MVRGQYSIVYDVDRRGRRRGRKIAGPRKGERRRRKRNFGALLYFLRVAFFLLWSRAEEEEGRDVGWY